MFKRTVNFVAFLIPCTFITAMGADQSNARRPFESRPVDLTKFYGKVTGTEGDTWFRHEDWKIVPKGLQTFDGIIFDVSGNLILKSTRAPQLREVARGISVKSHCRYIHLLHGTGHDEVDGKVIAVLEIHYSSGEIREFPIKYGFHVRNWWQEKRETTGKLFDEDSNVTWVGQGTYPPPEHANVRLCRSTFVNPLPDDEIDHIDLVSKNSGA